MLTILFLIEKKIIFIATTALYAMQVLFLERYDNDILIRYIKPNF
jgi:hypothetical protein